MPGLIVLIAFSSVTVIGLFPADVAAHLDDNLIGVPPSDISEWNYHDISTDSIYIYNKLVRLRYAVRNSWSDIDVHLKKRYELLPNLVEAVKGYAAHESGTFAKVAQLRSAAMRAQTPLQKARADNMLTETLKNLFAVAEAYPDLKADAHYREIMASMKEIDDNIEHARRFYNATVRHYNITTDVFPTNVVASAFFFQPEEFFSLDDATVERKPVKANFSRT